MRKRSLYVSLTILSVIALAACDDQNEVQHCVDENNVVVDEEKCADAGAPVDQNHTGHSGFFWFYGGRTRYSPGTRLSGGSYFPRANSTYSSPRGGFSYEPSVGVSRGGFGGSAHGTSAGAGE